VSADAGEGAPPLTRVAVVGGGTMGRDIAYVHLAAGAHVALLEAERGRLDAAIAAITGHLARRVGRGEIDADAQRAALARLTPTLDYEALAGAALAIEAVVEQLPVKQAVFRRLDAVLGRDAVLASNTSTLPIRALAAEVDAPERVLGLHFFSPARVMKLVEVVRAARTAPAVIARATAHVRALGKVPVVVGDCYGFVSNRLSMVYGAEAVALLEEGASPAEVDAPLVAFGMPMGPLTMSDLAGTDISYFAHPGLHAAYGDRARPSPLGGLMYERGRHGQKAGRGYYRYEAGARGGVPDPEMDALLDEVRGARGAPPRGPAPAEILERVLLVTVNEGARCLEEGVADSADDVDTIMRLGFGFPAAHGGPMRWAERELGWARVARTLRGWAETRAEPRYRPAAWIEERA
jgi:3-hydroxyacyl-CoA dehydrogenase